MSGKLQIKLGKSKEEFHKIIATLKSFVLPPKS